MTPEILNVAQLAEYLQYSTGHIYKLIRFGRLPAVKLGTRYRFLKIAIDQWLTQEMQDTQAQRHSKAIQTQAKQEFSKILSKNEAPKASYLNGALKAVLPESREPKE